MSRRPERHALHGDRRSGPLRIGRGHALGTWTRIDDATRVPARATQLSLVSSCDVHMLAHGVPDPIVRGPSGDEPIYGCPFTRMSFLTDSAPWTLRATATALLIAA